MSEVRNVVGVGTGAVLDATVSDTRAGTTQLNPERQRANSGGLRNVEWHLGGPSGSNAPLVAWTAPLETTIIFSVWRPEFVAREHAARRAV